MHFDLTTDLADLSAVGTLALAATTYVLARRTRESVEEAERSRVLWTSLAIDTARARLDQATPVVDVHVWEVAWPPTVTGPQSSSTDGGELGWSLEEDGDQQRIEVRAQIRLYNRSKRAVFLNFSGESLQGPVDSSIAFTTLLPENEDGFPMFLSASFTLAEWAENYRAARSSSPLPHCASAKITFSDLNNNGIDDTWNLSLTGTPVEPVPGSDGSWRLSVERGGSMLIEDTVVRVRRYWLSRSENLILPEPTYVPETTHSPRNRRLGLLRRSRTAPELPPAQASD